MRKAALYIQGRIVLGSSHLDAFQKLSDKEKSLSDLLSGFYDDSTGEFQGYVEEEHFFEKEIILMRHGRPKDDGSPDPDLSAEGYAQVESAGDLLSQMYLDGFVGYCSPMLRCLRTAHLISESTGINFRVEPNVMEAPPFLSPGDMYFLPARSSIFPRHDWPSLDGWHIGHESNSTFLSRISQVLRALPKKSMIVSHSGFVTNMAKMALCDETVVKCGVPTASLTHIENREVRCLGRNV